MISREELAQNHHRISDMIEVAANKRRAKERVRERKKTARINFLHEYRAWIMPIGVSALLLLFTVFILILEAVL